jgi:hypothetical protein
MGYIECSEKSCGNSVFSKGLCRKHYEQGRVLLSPPCSISNCISKAYRGTLCSSHYRAHIKSLHPECKVPGCTAKQKTLKSELCEKHLFRHSRHGNVEQTRPNDWGAREKHPLYKTYLWHKRKANNPLVDEWVEDFWKFTECVGDKPEGCILRKKDINLPLGPTNWEWKETYPSKNKADYARDWRKNNPEKAKNADLKKMYGIDYATYKQMLADQNCACAICEKIETDVDSFGIPRHMPVDHCHTTGVVRGLLCGPCNRALGSFKDDIAILKKAIAYLQKSTKINLQD